MISVLVLGSSTAAGRSPTSGDAVRTLAALVPAAVDGAVRDVQLLATEATADLGRVAEHAGCGFVLAADLGAALRTGAAQARSPDLLVLLTGVSFDRALADEITAIGARHSAWITEGIALKAMESGALGRLLPRFAPTVGVMTERSRLVSVTAGNARSLWRELRARRLFKTLAWSGAGA